MHWSVQIISVLSNACKPTLISGLLNNPYKLWFKLYLGCSILQHYTEPIFYENKWMKRRKWRREKERFWRRPKNQDQYHNLKLHNMPSELHKHSNNFFINLLFKHNLAKNNSVNNNNHHTLWTCDLGSIHKPTVCQIEQQIRDWRHQIQQNK